MASSIINSDDGLVSGTTGLKSVGGDDGVLNIQSNGSTVVAVNGSGVSVTGTLSSSGGYGAVSASTLTVNSNNISADNSLGFRNRIINGAMMIDQRNAGASVTPASSAYTLDRWQAIQTATSNRFSVQQNAGAVTPPVGFTKYLGVVSLSAHSLAAGDFYQVKQLLEGFNVADFDWGTSNARSITVSFWVRSSLTGSFGLVIAWGGSNANQRTYPILYSITSANTWEYKTITIPGDTTMAAGGFETSNSIGVQLRFSLGGGATNAGTSGAWATANYQTVTGDTSVVSTNGATLYVTGVQLEVGSVATPFERRPFGTELQLCQRYYEKSYAFGTVPGTNTVTGLCQSLNGADGNQVAGIRFLVPKRATPTGFFWSKSGTASSLSNTSYVDAPNTGSWSTMGDASEFGFRCIVGTGGLSNGTAYTWHYTASAEF